MGVSWLCGLRPVPHFPFPHWWTGWQQISAPATPLAPSIALGPGHSCLPGETSFKVTAAGGGGSRPAGLPPAAGPSHSAEKCWPHTFLPLSSQMALGSVRDQRPPIPPPPPEARIHTPLGWGSSRGLRSLRCGGWVAIPADWPSRNFKGGHLSCVPHTDPNELPCGCSRRWCEGVLSHLGLASE